MFEVFYYLGSVNDSALQLAALATAAIPGLDVVDTYNAAVSHDDTVATGLVSAGGDRLVVLLPLNEAAGENLDRHARLLVNLDRRHRAGELPIAVPVPIGAQKLTDGRRAIVYRDLPGRQLEASEVTRHAAEIADVLAAIHGLPTRLIERAELPSASASDLRKEAFSQLNQAKRHYDFPPVLLNHLNRGLENDSLWDFAPTVIHGNLDADSFRVESGSLVGVGDFNSMRVSDPARDFVWMMDVLSDKRIDEVFTRYAAKVGRQDDSLGERISFWTEFGIVEWLLYGVERDDAAICSEAVEMLDDLEAAVAEEHTSAGEKRYRDESRSGGTNRGEAVLGGHRPGSFNPDSDDTQTEVISTQPTLLN